jgi:hypothetical protein
MCIHSNKIYKLVLEVENIDIYRPYIRRSSEHRGHIYSEAEAGMTTNKQGALLHTPTMNHAYLESRTS